MNIKIKNLIDFSLIGIAAYLFTDIIHEIIGHGSLCLLSGQKISLLTSVYFISKPGSIITDLGGPISNLLFGIGIFYVFKVSKDLSWLSRLLLFLIMSYNLYWFSGTILQSSFSSSGDWTYSVKQLNIGVSGKILLIIAGIITYYFTIKLSKIEIIKIELLYSKFPLRQFIYYSYFAAAISAFLAGLFFTPDRLTAARLGLFEMIASIPIILIPAKKKRNVDLYKIKSNPISFNIIIIILFILFCMTLGRGLVFQ